MDKARKTADNEETRYTSGREIGVAGAAPVFASKLALSVRGSIATWSLRQLTRAGKVLPTSQFLSTSVFTSAESPLLNKMHSVWEKGGGEEAIGSRGSRKFFPY